LPLPEAWTDGATSRAAVGAIAPSITAFFRLVKLLVGNLQKRGLTILPLVTATS